MKKLIKERTIDSIWFILLIVTVAGERKDIGFFINLIFLAIMEGFIAWTRKNGLSRMDRVAKQLNEINEVLENEHGSNAMILSTMDYMQFDLEAVDADWRRFLRDWEKSRGFDCNIEDYLSEDEILGRCNYNMTAQVPGILTAMGILGTFLGLVIGLQNFDFSDVENMTSSVEALVDGLNIAFYTSIYGVLLSIIYNLMLRHCESRVTRALNSLYDTWNCVLVPEKEHNFFDKLCDKEDEQNSRLTEITGLLDERLGKRLGTEMAETLMPVFDRITHSLDHVILDFHKEQADSLEKIVDAFVDQMGGALNGHVEILGASVEQLSETQQMMTIELKDLIKKISKTGKDTAKINEQAGEILSGLNGYVPKLQETAEASAEIIAQMGTLAVGIDQMANTQNAILESLSGHEENLDAICTRMSASQDELNKRLSQFTEAAKVLADREKDPLQYEDFKDMLSRYMASMQKMQSELNLQTQNLISDRIDALINVMAGNAGAQNDYNEKLYTQMERFAKAQEDLVFLNGRMAGMMAGRETTSDVRKPSASAQPEILTADAELRLERMEHWMETQSHMLETLVEIEREKSVPIWRRLLQGRKNFTL